jgi:hypothetical protein
MGFAPMAHANDGPEHADHCNMMMHGSQSESAPATSHSHEDSSAHKKHGGECSSGCQCGCIHAPVSLPPVLQSLDAVSHPSQAQVAADLNIQARPGSVFKPPI